MGLWMANPVRTFSLWGVSSCSPSSSSLNGNVFKVAGRTMVATRRATEL
jgi:hypothetical protein